MEEVLGPTKPRNSQVLHLGAPIVLQRSRLLIGANRYHGSTVLCHRVNFGSLSGKTCDMFGRGFAQMFLDRFAGLKSFRRHISVREDFISALRTSEGVGFPDVVLNAILALYYYLTFIKVMYVDPNEDTRPIPVPQAYVVVLVITSVGMLLMGTLASPWWNWALEAAGNLVAMTP